MKASSAIGLVVAIVGLYLGRSWRAPTPWPSCTRPRC